MAFWAFERVESTRVSLYLAEDETQLTAEWNSPKRNPEPRAIDILAMIYGMCGKIEVGKYKKNVSQAVLAELALAYPRRHCHTMCLPWWGLECNA